jgi:single-strand DNA-binding protein
MSIGVSFPGNLGQDAELRHTPNGTQVLSFSVGTTVYRNKEKHTHWMRCSIFGKRAESLAPMLLKGSSVFVRGSLEPREYEAKGEKKFSLDVMVDDVEFIGGKRESGDPGAYRPQQQRPATRAPAAAPPPQNDFGGSDESFGDELPF